MAPPTSDIWCHLNWQPTFSALSCCPRNPRVCHPQDIPHPQRIVPLEEVTLESEDRLQWFPGLPHIQCPKYGPNTPEVAARKKRKTTLPSFGVVDGVSCLVQGCAIGQVPHVVHEESSRQARSSSTHRPNPDVHTPQAAKTTRVGAGQLVKGKTQTPEQLQART